MSDFLAELPEENPAEALLREVMVLVNALLEARKARETIEAQLEEAKKKERELNEKVIPDLLTRNRLTKLVLANKATVEVKEDLSASVPEDPDKKEKCYKWLAGHGGADLIKDEVTILDPTVGLLNVLHEQGLEYERNKKVNAASLKAFLRGELGIGAKNSIVRLQPADVPAELGLYRYWKTSIKGA